VLGVERISRNDDFFATLAGHSLLATQVASRLRDELQVDLPLRRLFEYPTLAGLAPIIEGLLFEELDEITDEDAARLVMDES